MLYIARLSRMQVPMAHVADKNIWFVDSEDKHCGSNEHLEKNDVLAIENIKPKSLNTNKKKQQSPKLNEKKEALKADKLSHSVFNKEFTFGNTEKEA
jgi:hypothetical protein